MPRNRMPSTRRQRILVTAAAATAVAVLVCAYRMAVEATGFMPRCMFKWATGLDCPGCGSQRALGALIEGDLHGALTHNLLLPPAICYLALLTACYIFRDNPCMTRLHRAVTSAEALAAIAAAVVVWMVARNIADI